MAATAFIDRLKALEASDLLSAQLGLPQTAFLGPSSATGSLDGSKLLASPAAAQAYLRSIYPALRRHYHWFRTSQKGQLKPWGRKPPSRLEAYRWRGRTEKHVLTSGLDDYPRATPPSNGELHLDLLCWMGFFSRAMGEIAEYLGEDFAGDLAEYERNGANILANLDALHWSEEDQMYCDVTVDDEGEGFLLPFLSNSSLNESTADDLLYRDICLGRRVHLCLPRRLHLPLPAPDRPSSALLPAARPDP